MIHVRTLDVIARNIFFNPRHCMLEGNGFKTKLQKTSRKTRTTWKKFLEPALNMRVASIGMAARAKTKNLQVALATTNVLKIYFRWKSVIINRHARGRFEIASYMKYFNLSFIVKRVV